MNWKVLTVLIVIETVYIIIGGLIFKATEEAAEKSRRLKLQQEIENFRDKYSNIDSDEFNDLIQLVSYYSSHGITYTDGKNWALWDFASSVCFSITLITTIGYGDIVPSTDAGKLVCIPYALVGIPMTLTLLGGIGERLGKFIAKISHMRLCSKHYPRLNKVFDICIITALGLLLLFFAPSLVFHFLEGWKITEGLYFCFITLTTVGFGDLVPGAHKNVEVSLNYTERTLYKVLVYAWILVGLAYLSLIINLAVVAVSNTADRMREKAVDKLENNEISIVHHRHHSLLHDLASYTVEKDEDDDCADLCERCRKLVKENRSNVSLIRMKTNLDSENSVIYENCHINNIEHNTFM
ncbi:potassium channel, subfamily K, member 16-like [Tubulanus polymorphus]|uniref:potassium channel, subfamily K, member 16-like n=1 Tax=Tubulanus polymorphus TaxID=672921 RepID=UPI003DA2A356